MPSRPFLPDAFLSALKKGGAPKVNSERLLQELKEAGKEPEPGVGVYLNARMTADRYGVALPAEVQALFAAADEFSLEDVKFKSYRYLRAAPGGWEIPGTSPQEPLIATFCRRFEWNAFSNMQLLEHFGGLVCIGWGGDGDDRVYAAMHETGRSAPVFVMDHETAELEGCIARSLSNYLRAQLDPETTAVPAEERSLVLKPEHRSKYLDVEAPLRLNPLFLERRARWIVAALGLVDAKEVATQLQLPEARCFDATKELPDVARNVPLAMYWLFRSYFLGEGDLFDAAEKAAGLNPSPLVRSAAEIARARWESTDKNSRLVLMRNALKKLKPPQQANWSRSGWRAEAL